MRLVNADDDRRPVANDDERRFGATEVERLHAFFFINICYRRRQRRAISRGLTVVRRLAAGLLLRVHSLERVRVHVCVCGVLRGSQSSRQKLSTPTAASSSSSQRSPPPSSPPPPPPPRYRLPTVAPRRQQAAAAAAAGFVCARRRRSSAAESEMRVSSRRRGERGGGGGERRRRQHGHSPPLHAARCWTTRERERARAPTMTK